MDWMPTPAAFRRAVASGVLATVTMDVAMGLAPIFGGTAFNPPRLKPQMIGRWVKDLARGHLLNEDILAETPGRGELAIGMLTHYATGTGLTMAFMAIPRDRPPRLREATVYGVATSTLPLLVMFPSMGYGFAGQRSGEAGRLVRVMLLGHVAFGLGIGIWARRFWTLGARTPA